MPRTDIVFDISTPCTVKVRITGYAVEDGLVQVEREIKGVGLSDKAKKDIYAAAVKHLRQHKLITKEVK